MSDELIELVFSETEERMGEAVSAARREFSTVRTGRASSALVERIGVNAYGAVLPMQQIASFSIPEAGQLLITPHDRNNIAAIERAINQSNLGLSPANDGTVLRLFFPPLTAQRRRELARVVGSMAESSRNQIRGIRRAARKDLESLEKDAGVSSDAIHRAAKHVDEITRSYELRLSEARARKEEELLEL